MSQSSLPADAMPRRGFLRGALAGLACGVLDRVPVRAWAQGRDPGSRSLFDGRTLAGWHAVPRAAPEQWARYERLKTGGVEPLPKDEALKAVMAQKGRWTVEDGAIVGGQDTPGSGRGAYLVSDEAFADFELELEANPDWPIDTGVMIRCQPIGSVGFQVLVDHRPNGCIGGFYGNGIGGFRAFPFILDADTAGPPEGPWRPTRFRPGVKPDGVVTPPQYSAPIDDFIRAWRPGAWNRLRIRCTGELPVLTTWINGVKIAELDSASYAAPGYDPKDVAAKLGRAGHIAFEVHSNDPKIGKERWWPGAVCRWRDIQIRVLGPPGTSPGRSG
jgi:hypothetical protein